MVAAKPPGTLTRPAHGAPPGTLTKPTSGAPPGTITRPTHGAPPGTPVPRDAPKQRTFTGPVARGNTPATGGASPRTQEAARITGRGWRAAGSGRAAAAGHFSVRGVLWLFVWLGVLFYLVSNPATLPRAVHLVFAPVNGLIAVARGGHAVGAKIA